MNLFRAALIISLMMVSLQALSSEIVVVVNQNNPTDNLSRSELIDLYMGKYVAFPDGSKAVPLDIENDTQVRQQFYQALLGMPLARVNAYWSRVKFSGRARPPLKQIDQDAVIEYLNQTDNGIGYIYADKVSGNLKVVYSFD